MVKVAVIEEKKLGAVSWWRCYRPLMYAQRMFHREIDIDFIGNRLEITDLMKYHVIVVFRPTDPMFAELIKTAKHLGIKVIIDVDDDLINLDPHHQLYAKYAARKSQIIELFRMADYIWCSTDQLMYSMDCFGRGEVIANAIHPDDLPAKPSKWNRVAMWRGNANHYADFAKAEEQWITDKDIHDCDWVWLGMRPGFVAPNVGVTLPSMPILDYLAFLKNRDISFIWKPLEKNIFNDAKSNIAWLEATIAGGVCVTNYDSPEWCCASGFFSMDERTANKVWEESCDHILEHYNIINTAKQRFESIIRLCESEKTILT